jgi:O-antigen/teichoic acid export membrane protein
MSADERVPSEPVDGAAIDLIVPPDTAPLARQTLAYGLSGLLVPLVGMITLPIFARTFTQAQYGILELATTATTVAIAITDAGLTAAALRGFYDYRDDDESERRAVLTTGFGATSVLAVALATALVLLRRPFSELLFGNSHEQTVVVLLAVAIPALNTWRYVSEVMRVRLKAFHYLAMSVIAAFVTTGLLVVGILALGWRVNGALVAGLIGNWAAAAYGIVFVAGSISGRFSRGQLKRMLAYGLPLVPAALAAWALALVDRIILARLGSIAQVGQYAVANRLASLLLIGLTAFLFALTPFLLATYSEDPDQEKAARARTLTYLTFILSLSGLVLTLFAWEIVTVVAPNFIEAYKAVGPLMLGAIGYGLVSLLTTGFSIARKTGRLALLTLIAAGVNIGLNFALIPPYGIVGAAFATTIGYGVLAASYYWAAQRVYWTPFELEKVLITLVLASALGVVGVLPLGSEAVAIPVKLLALAVFLLGVGLSGAITRAELVELRRFAHGMVPIGLWRSRA